MVLCTDHTASFILRPKLNYCPASWELAFYLHPESTNPALGHSITVGNLSHLSWPLISKSPYPPLGHRQPHTVPPYVAFAAIVSMAEVEPHRERGERWGCFHTFRVLGFCALSFKGPLVPLRTYNMSVACLACSIWKSWKVSCYWRDEKTN